MTFSRVVRVESTGSTNSDLIRALSDNPDAWPHLSVLVADAQTEGRGRNGNVWSVPPGRALTCSVVLEPGPIPTTWVPLAVGLAVTQALAPWVNTLLKWPNDVVLDEPAASWGFGRKIGGILCELHPSGRVVAGIGINCRQSEAELPVPWAVSLQSAGLDAPAPADLLEALGEAIAAVWSISNPTDLHERYVKKSAVVGQEVEIALPGGDSVTGTVSGIDGGGALLLASRDGTLAVVAGDVFGVRPRPRPRSV